MPRAKSTTKRVVKSRTKRRSSAAKRERIAPGGDTRYVRRDGSGRFNESDDAGRSSVVDRRKRAKAKVSSGLGDRGDRRTVTKRRSSR